MLKITDDLVSGTKKEIVDFLLEKEKWFIDYANPFEEMRMVSYINQGLRVLDSMACNDNTKLEMFDKEGNIQFNIVDELEG